MVIALQCPNNGAFAVFAGQSAMIDVLFVVASTL